MSQTYIINNTNDFYKYFHLLKKDARVGSTPDVFVVGFDAEFISEANHPESFLKAGGWTLNTPNKTAVCIVQMSSNKVCLVINLSKMGLPIPDLLFKAIKNDSWVKLGVGIENDLSIISQNYNLDHCGGGIELKNLALMANYPDPSLESLYNQLAGDHIKKKSSVCDWSGDLTKNQLLYAAKDAVISYHLGQMIIYPSIKVLEGATYDKLNTKLDIEFVNHDLDKVDDNYDADADLIFNKNNTNSDNYIGNLYEYCQQNKSNEVTYHEVKSTKLHTFCYSCTLTTDDGAYTEQGIGTSKKEAKRLSAKNVLAVIYMFDDLKNNVDYKDVKSEIDYISQLNEYIQVKNYLTAPKYYEVDPVLIVPPKYRIQCCIDRVDSVMMYKTIGEGVSKREAKNNGALDMINKLRFMN